MPYYHATWRRHLKSILRHGLGGALPDEQNFPVERGVYLAVDPSIALFMLVEAYLLKGEENALPPPDTLEQMCVIVIDDARLADGKIEADPNVERKDATFLYRGIVDVTGMPVLSVEQVQAWGGPNDGRQC